MIKHFVKEAIPEDFPYRKCIYCESIGKDCEGPNLFAMGKDMRVLRDWCVYRASYLHSVDPSWTVQRIADEAHLSRRTIDRLFGDDPPDLRVSTMHDIGCVLMGHSRNGESCKICCAAEDYIGLASRDIADLEEKLTALEEEKSVLSKAADMIGEEYKLNIALYEKKYAQEKTLLRERLDDAATRLHEVESELRHKTEMLQREQEASKNLRRYLRWVAMFAIAMAIAFVLYFILFDLTSRTRGLVRW